MKYILSILLTINAINVAADTLILTGGLFQSDARLELFESSEHPIPSRVGSSSPSRWRREYVEFEEGAIADNDSV